MYLKLALRNIKRSVRDYAVYFITLLFGVAIFYAFNSIGSQQVLFDLQSETTEHQFATTARFLETFSGVIAFVLGFLILYANRFLIKRRKRELGTYLVLGMNSVQVSRIVLYETVLVGLFSLACGLLLGFILSQGLSFFTALLFNTTISNYQFVFSFDAFILTLICFAAVYLIVLLLNAFSITRYKLIDLLYADKKNDRVLVRNPWACFAFFILSIGILAFAYYELIQNGLVMLDDPSFMYATIGMLVGSLLFFWSLAGFAIAILTRMRSVYFRGLNLFTVRQVASQINTAFASLWIVCILLFFSITVFSTGMGFIEVFVGDVQKSNPFSATLDAEIWYGPGGDRRMSSGDPLERRAEMQAEASERLAQAESYDWDMSEALRAAAPKLWEETIAATAQIDIYSVPGVTYEPLFEAAWKEDPSLDQAMIGEESVEQLSSSFVQVITASALNAACELQGLEPINIEPGKAVMVNNMQITSDIARAIASSGVSIEMEDERVTLEPKVHEVQLEDNVLMSSALVIAVPDSFVEAIKAEDVIPERSFLDVMYADNGKTDEENDLALARIVSALQPKDIGGFEKGFAGEIDEWASLLWPVTRIITAYQMVVQSNGMRLMITYLALYIGFIFLISVAAVLAIQQLSQVADSSMRFRTLWRLGCDNSMLNHALLAQVLIYFLVPLGLALCHSVCAIGVLSETLLAALGVSLLEPIALAALLVVIIYGGYMVVTYLCAKGMMKSALTER